MKPLIAISTRISKPKNNIIYYANKDYFDAIYRSNGIPILLPIISKEDLESILPQFDGVLFTGGHDIDPSFYNENNRSSFPKYIEEDESDIFLIRKCLELNIPIMGVCKGLQLINVACKGTLYQDIKTEYSTPLEHDQDKIDPNLKKDVTLYDFTTVENTLMHKVYGPSYKSNSFHHQAIKKLGENLTISALSPDNIIEAIEIKNKLIAVQFHPEKLIDNDKHLSLFKNFIEMCKPK